MLKTKHNLHKKPCNAKQCEGKEGKHVAEVHHHYHWYEQHVIDQGKDYIEHMKEHQLPNIPEGKKYNNDWKIIKKKDRFNYQNIDFYNNKKPENCHVKSKEIEHIGISTMFENHWRNKPDCELNKDGYSKIYDYYSSNINRNI